MRMQVYKLLTSNTVCSNGPKASVGAFDLGDMPPYAAGDGSWDPICAMVAGKRREPRDEAPARARYIRSDYNSIQRPNLISSPTEPNLCWKLAVQTVPYYAHAYVENVYAEGKQVQRKLDIRNE